MTHRHFKGGLHSQSFEWYRESKKKTK